MEIRKKGCSAQLLLLVIPGALVLPVSVFVLLVALASLGPRPVSTPNPMFPFIIIIVVVFVFGLIFMARVFIFPSKTMSWPTATMLELVNRTILAHQRLPQELVSIKILKTTERNVPFLDQRIKDVVPSPNHLIIQVDNAVQFSSVKLMVKTPARLLQMYLGSMGYSHSRGRGSPVDILGPRISRGIPGRHFAPSLSSIEHACGHCCSELLSSRDTWRRAGNLPPPKTWHSCPPRAELVLRNSFRR